MAWRGWTEAQIAEAQALGEHLGAVNLETGGSPTRYIHPATGGPS
jgi:hypothetical protein